MAKSSFHLIVFGRYPQVGRVKTRLIPSLGPAGAAFLQKRLTEATITAARRAIQRLNGRLVFCHDGGSERQIGAWLTGAHLTCCAQPSGDLGKRMLCAFQRAFGQGAERVVLVGTDIPGIPHDELENAFDLLASHDLVLGPSTDGGYWLIGMRGAHDLFSGMTWSQSDVLEKTLLRARQMSLRCVLLKPRTDLDTEKDLNRPSYRAWAQRPYVTVVVPALNEAQCIAATLETARSPDAELIVSDGGSSDRTAAVARASGARVLVGKRGRAVQQNRGAAVARGEVLLFLHADTRLPPNYVAHVFEAFMDPKTILGAFRFDTDLKTVAMDGIVYVANLRSGRFKLPYGDQGLFLRRADFDAIGGFPDTPIAEDLYLVKKLARRGRITIAPASAVTSARRWKQLGPTRTTLVNALIAAGCLLGVAPRHLAPLYGRRKK